MTVAMRSALLLLILVLGLPTAGFSQSKVDEKEAHALYQSYQRHRDNKNWILANNFANAIVRKYPRSEAAKKVKPELPEISKLAEGAYKEQQAKQKRDAVAAAERQKQDAAAAKKRQATSKKALAALRKGRDDVQRITFYESRSTPKTVANNWHLYIGVPDNGRPYLRFKWMYAAERWLFIRSVVLNIDGQKTGAAELGHFTVKRDNSGGQIWEWHDESVEDSAIPFFKRLAESKKTIIRYEGDKYYDDRTLSSAEKKAFIQVLDAYEALQGGVRQVHR